MDLRCQMELNWYEAGKHGVQLRHEWFDNEYRRDAGEWNNWDKEVGNV